MSPSTGDPFTTAAPTRDDIGSPSSSPTPKPTNSGMKNNLNVMAFGMAFTVGFLMIFM